MKREGRKDAKEMREELTDEQAKDLRHLRRYIEREQLSPVMNDTKWREAVNALAAIPDFAVRFRVRCLREPAPAMDRWEVGFPWHVPTFRAIEWLDIATTTRSGTDFTNTVAEILRAVDVPFSVEKNAIRVWGYLRLESDVSLS